MSSNDPVIALLARFRDEGVEYVLVGELDSSWFEAGPEIENIRVADELLVDLHFAANGETYESVQPIHPGDRG